jgi:ketosteroid isomerase-like protein
MTDNRTPSEIAVAFIDAFAAGDTQAVAALIADDIVFESPQVKLVGADAVLHAISQFVRAVTGVRNVTVLGDDERAMVMYDMDTGPFGTLKVVDHLVVRDGKIVSDTLVFDTYEVRKANEPRSATL